MSERAGPASSEIKNAEKFEKIKNGKVVAVIGFFENDKADGVKNFLAVAEELRGKVKFAHTFSADVMKAADVEAQNINLYRPAVMKSKFEDQVVVFETKKFTTGVIRSWVRDNANGL